MRRLCDTIKVERDLAALCISRPREKFTEMALVLETPRNMFFSFLWMFLRATYTVTVFSLKRNSYTPSHNTGGARPLARTEKEISNLNTRLLSREVRPVRPAAPLAPPSASPQTASSTRWAAAGQPRVAEAAAVRGVRADPPRRRRHRRATALRG